MAHNEGLVDRPGLLTTDPFGGGWMLIVRPTGDDWRKGLTDGAAIAEAVDVWIAGGSYRDRNS